MLTTLSNLIKAIGSIFGWAEKRSEQSNTPEMRANAAGKTEQELKDEAAAAVAARDAETIRRRLAE